MGENPRDSGIDLIGHVPWGTHFCQFYETKEDLSSILVPYFMAGLRSNEFCMWVTAEPLEVEDALGAMRAAMSDFDAYLDNGQIEIVPYQEWYLAVGLFDSQRVLNGWIDKMNDALNRGFEGLRLTGNTFWLEKENWTAFLDYEQEVNNIIGNYKMLAICTYSLDKCNAGDILEVMNTHQFALIKEGGEWKIIESADHKRIESILQENIILHHEAELKFKVLDQLQRGLIEVGFDYQAIIDFIARTLTDFIGDACSIRILSEDKRHIPIAAFHHRDPEAEALISELSVLATNSVDESLPGRVAQSREPIFIPVVSEADLAANVPPAFKQYNEKFGVSSQIAIPLLGHDIVIGVISLSRTSDQPSYTQDDFSFVQEVADRAALSLDNARLFAEKNDAMHLSEALHEITMILNSTLDYKVALQRAIEMSTNFIGAESSSLVLLEEGNWVVRFTYNFPSDILGSSFSDDVALNSVLAAQSKQPVIITDTNNADQPNRDRLQSFGIRSMIAFPLIISDQVIGLVYFNYHTMAVTFNLAEIEFGQKLAASISLAINTNRLFEENVKSLEKIREQANLLDDVLKTLPVGVIIRDKSGKVVQINEEANKIWGGSRYVDMDHFSVYKGWWTSTGERIKDEEWPGCRSLFHGESILNTEIEIEDFSGERKIVLDSSVPIFDANQEISGTVVMIQDITALKQASKELRERSNYARDLIEASLDPLVTIDADGKITDVNKATEQVTGYSRDELIGSDFSDYFTEPEKARAGYQQVFTEGSVHDYPLAIRNRLGNITDVSYNATVYTNETDEIQGVFAAARDVTERKKAEQKIRQQAELLDNAHDAITLRDLDNRILYWNKGSERLYGWKASEVIGKISHEVIFKGDYSQPLNALKIVKEKGEWNGEMTHQDRDGKEIIVDSRWTLMNDADGNPESVLVINYDITEKKRLEKQLLRTQRMESIGTLAGGIAHDMNNILTPITMAIGLFKDTLQDEESQNILAILETNVNRATDLTKQILSFARGVEGERQAVQIDRLIGEIEKTIKETFPRSIDIQTNVPSDLWSITGDYTQLHQVLMNLCLNARDAMPFGGTLTISAENLSIDANYATMNPDAKPGPYVVISVTDTGTGMPPAVLDRIFEPFFTTKKQGEGTGLGLPTSLGIVKGHGGFIHVYSEVGMGSTFKVFLPSISVVEESEEEQQLIGNLQGNGELILVVDDEEMIRTIITTALAKNGYTTLVASDGAEAVAVYAQEKGNISAVILDMMMPVMDGYACIRALRKLDPGVKIIGVSGLGQNGKHPEIASRTTTFLAKPFTTEKLLVAVRDILSSE